ncbi:MAG: cyclase family protein [Anaerolineae bacterium]|nr:cyclase family protein [Anaerolineae bacterium]
MPIHDITLTITPSLPVWPGDPPVNLPQPARMDRGDVYNLTRLDISAHTGTHLDAPAHFIAGGAGVETLDLNVLIGPALVVDTGDADALTADVLASLPIPAGTQRVLFKTRSSELWNRSEDVFVEDFVAVTGDGAQWLVDRSATGGRRLLVGRPFDDPVPLSPYPARRRRHPGRGAGPARHRARRVPTDLPADQDRRQRRRALPGGADFIGGEGRKGRERKEKKGLYKMLKAVRAYPPSFPRFPCFPPFPSFPSAHLSVRDTFMTRNQIRLTSLAACAG